MPKVKIIITSKDITIIRGGKRDKFPYTEKGEKLIKEHLTLTPSSIGRAASTYVVEGGPLAQTIETLRVMGGGKVDTVKAANESEATEPKKKKPKKP